MKLQDTIAEEFDEFSKNYTDDMVACVPHYAKLLSNFTDYLPQNFLPKQILDVGCGNGNATYQLLQKFKQAHYTLLDASGTMLELCKKRFGHYNITTEKSFFQDFNFKKTHFDMVVAGFSIHHCHQKEKKLLFKSIYESLNEGGVFACSDLMIDKNQKEHKQYIADWSAFVLENSSDRKKWDWLMDHYNEYDNPDHLNNQLSWLKDVGFSDFNVIIYDTHWVHFKCFKK